MNKFTWWRWNRKKTQQKHATVHTDLPCTIGTHAACAEQKEAKFWSFFPNPYKTSVYIHMKISDLIVQTFSRRGCVYEYEKNSSGTGWRRNTYFCFLLLLFFLFRLPSPMLPMLPMLSMLPMHKVNSEPFVVHISAFIETVFRIKAQVEECENVR